MSRVFLLLGLALWGLSCHPRGILFVPSPPAAHGPGNGERVRVRRPTLWWTQVPEAQRYHLQVDDRTSFLTPVAEDSTLTDTLWTPSFRLDLGQSYYWRVRAWSPEGGWGDWSEADSFYVDPNPLEVIAFCPTPGFARDIFVAGHLAFVANSEAGVAVVDISDPANPFLLGMYDTPLDARGVWAHDTTLFVADWGVSTGGVLMLDARRPDSLRFINSAFASRTESVTGYVHGDTVFVVACDSDDGLLLYDTSIPGFLNQRGTALAFPGAIYRARVQFPYAYVAAGQLGLWIVGLSNPDEKVVVGSLDLPGTSRSVFAQGNRAAVAARSGGGLFLVDVTDPASPQLLGAFRKIQTFRDVWLQDTLAFAAAGGQGFVILSVANPEDPYLLGRMDFSYAYAVFFDGTYFYGADREGLYIFRLSP